MKKTLLSLFLLLMISTSVMGQSLKEIHWISEQYPPYNFIQNGKKQGLSFEILMQMFQIVGLNKGPKDIQFMPWSRSYLLLQRQKNTALFSMTYTEERAKLFKLVGPVIPSTVSIIAKKSSELKIESIADINYLRIGVIREDIGEQLLKSLKVKRRVIKREKNPKKMIRKLDKERFDAIAYANDIAFYNMKLMGIDSKQYESVYTLKKGAMYYAFHKDTDDRILSKLQKALDQLKSNGTVDRIVKKYLQ